MIPKSNLDDRTFEEITAEAVRLIPRYCPEWTNHNPSDPGMALVELFAWMTELVIYRLNQVPEKTYLSLLELMGLSLIPPQSARAVVRFYPAEGYRKAVPIRRGTQIAAVAGDDGTYLFETEQDIAITNAALASCVNRTGEQWIEYCREGEIQPFRLFEAGESVEHYLYIGSAAFSHLTGEHTVQISFTTSAEIGPAGDELTNYLYWEYWDGRSWVHAAPRRSVEKKRKKDNVVYFSGPKDIKAGEVNGRAAYYLRAALAEAPERREMVRIKGIEVQTYFGGSGFMPDRCAANSGLQYFPVDMNSAFRIFSENPSYNELFYLAADEVFSAAGNKVSILFLFSEIYVPGNENENAKYFYEYWGGDDWKKLGESPWSEGESNPHGFEDGTLGFKKSGEVRFIVPRDFGKTAVDNEERYWVRVRLAAKDFSLGGAYIKDDKDNWRWQFSSKVHSPVFSKIRITYNAGARKPEQVFSHSNFVWKDLGESLGEPGEEGGGEISLFDLSQDTVPALYLGFTAAFPSGNTGLYVRIDEGTSPRPKAERFSFFMEIPLISRRWTPL